MSKYKGNIYRCCRGSVLLSVLIVAIVFSIVLLTITPIMQSYLKRSIYEYNEKQAELTARGTVQSILSALMNDSSALTSSVLSLTNTGDSLSINEIDLPVSAMGKATVKIVKLSPARYSIISRATVNGVQSTVAVRVFRKDTPIFAPEGFEGMYINKISISQGGFILDEKTDMAISSSLNLSGQASMSIGKNLILMPGTELKFTGSGNILVGDYIYTKDGTFSVQGNASLFLHGKAYDKNNSPLSPLVPANDRRYCPYIRPISGEMLQGQNKIPNWVKYDGSPFPFTGTLRYNQYYKISGTERIADITGMLEDKVSPVFPVFIIIKDKAVVTISMPVDPPVNGGTQTPRVYFILEGSASLTLPAESCIAAYGGSGSTINVDSTGTDTLNLYGQIHIGNLNNLNDKNYIALKYKAVNVGGSIGDEINIPSGAQWRIEQFTDDKY